ncbi:hypothetical protein OBBRIDRAFT_407713 [Obba rivulosa]|uniref:Uncharacterized protein n=1 Tax=Obba rivulosa TaxID=1052685 RepID=A0A8E2AJB6_9APHY|nr:hypothetical protein OBBRIDRAFT_407713 [Obba rivulosa]
MSKAHRVLWGFDVSKERRRVSSFRPGGALSLVGLGEQARRCSREAASNIVPVRFNRDLGTMNRSGCVNMLLNCHEPCINTGTAERTPADAGPLALSLSTLASTTRSLLAVSALGKRVPRVDAASCGVRTALPLVPSSINPRIQPVSAAFWCAKRRASSFPALAGLHCK